MSTYNPLKLSGAWRRSPPPPPQWDPIRYYAECVPCRTTFFGDTQQEADARKLAHNRKRLSHRGFRF